MAKCNDEVIFEGWLTKSPPTKRLWRAKWRRRWFILTHSGDIPGQCILSYYTDRNRRKFKGEIYLDQCEQVDVGMKLKEKNLKFDYIFDIKTPKRVYYLAADTEDEMKLWVTYISQVCGLKPTNEGDNFEVNDVEISEEHKSTIATVEPSCGAYIPISECLTGRLPVRDTLSLNLKLNNGSYFLQNNDFYEFHVPNQYVNYSNDSDRNYVNDIQDPRYYDSPRQLIPLKKLNNSHSDQSLNMVTNGNEISKKNDNGNSMSSSQQAEAAAVHPTSEGMINGEINSSGSVLPPPRPPKPMHIATSPCYLNLTSAIQLNHEMDEKHNTNAKLITDDTYDFPRSHNIESESNRNTLERKHCYNNAAPVKCTGGIIFKYDISPKLNPNKTVFRYDLKSMQTVEASPAHSPASPPPVVNRELKPRRKLSSDTNHQFNIEPSSPQSIAPAIDRKLKPSTPLQELHSRKSFLDEDGAVRRIRAAPSPIPPNGIGVEDLYQNESEVYHYVSKHMQYLDLDMQVLGTSTSSTIKSLAPKSLETNTVYKEVDFQKTEAFNLTRNNLEKERQLPLRKNDL